MTTILLELRAFAEAEASTPFLLCLYTAFLLFVVLVLFQMARTEVLQAAPAVVLDAAA